MQINGRTIGLSERPYLIAEMSGNHNHSLDRALEIVTAAAEDPPGPLLAQLKIGGIMVVPVGQSDTVQTLIRGTRTETGFDYYELRQVRFVPLVEGLGQT